MRCMTRKFTTNGSFHSNTHSDEFLWSTQAKSQKVTCGGHCFRIHFCFWTHFATWLHLYLASGHSSPKGKHGIPSSNNTWGTNSQLKSRMEQSDSCLLGESVGHSRIPKSNYSTKHHKPLTSQTPKCRLEKNISKCEVTGCKAFSHSIAAVDNGLSTFKVWVGNFTVSYWPRNAQTDQKWSSRNQAKCHGWLKTALIKLIIIDSGEQ